MLGRKDGPNRRSLEGLFDNLKIEKTSNRKSLPALPEDQNQSTSGLTCHYPVKLTCIPAPSSLFARHFVLPDWEIRHTQDPKGRAERVLVGPNNMIQVPCTNGPNKIECCSLCNPKNWVFQGSTYDPLITRIYAENDGCISSSILLKDPKFIVPWRYKNKRTGEISWKVIHMCGSQIRDAECETIVVNVYRDRKLRAWITKALEYAKVYEDSKLVESLLAMIHRGMGDYGLPRGATSSQADASLFDQMKSNGSNFVMLGDIEIGLCRHKAMLFKILCDYTGINCALITGYSTGGRHQWNVITLADNESYIIDPTSPHFTWTKKGSFRTKAYKIEQDSSFGHGGLTLKINGDL